MERSATELYTKISKSSQLSEECKRTMKRYVLRKFGNVSSDPIDWLDREQLYWNLLYVIDRYIERVNFRARHGGTKVFEEYELEDLKYGPNWFEDLYHPNQTWRTAHLWRNMKPAVILYKKRRPHVYLTEYFEAMAEKCWQ